MKSKKVLIVDHNDMNRRLIENLIEQLCRFDSVKNGIEAVDRASKVKFDLILMAIQMPIMDGITAAKAIWRSSPFTCPVVAVSAYSEGYSNKCLVEMGFKNVISKPIRPKELLEMVSAILSCPDEEKLNFQNASKILDKEVFLQLSKFNPPKNLRSLYIEFLEEFDQLMCLIKKDLDTKNMQSIIENLHTIKGNSGTLGATAIFAISSDADKLARAEDWDKLETSLKDLINERILFENYLEEETIFSP
ncbi:CheY chemotaxis protein or a CheY-like REC (receiver) domain [Algoriphagus locisalis]|uniref:CheY chemotaxis protein or a CheY-like REC (Receiver) domain n=1 Tax=Algoriphagus locisalis TaxID=305507 RepID=A0A1I7E0F4_9BACT|nr:response regulator [Algoriphagus locisalis]SFU17401.1 CheY chemotaxis protein or a CheY-like REC (receiver) domain [Algoriphagus locisalis]